MRSRLLLVLALPSLACPSKAPTVEPTATGGETQPDSTSTPDSGSEPASAEFKVPRFQRTNIGTSGLSAYLPPGFPELTAAPSEDGSQVHAGELEQGGFVYGVIGLRFATPLDDDPESHEQLLVTYLDFLKTQLGVTEAAGYGLGHQLESEPSARGVIDYWKDASGRQLAIKGWVTQTHLAVLYIAGPTEYPVFNAQQIYLDGIRFSPAP
jgi:hypothetical protein